VTGPIVIAGIRDSFRKLDPRVQVRNPVMFVVYVGSILTTAVGIAAAVGGARESGHPGFVLAIAAWLWLHGAVRQFRRSRCRGPRQGAGGRPAVDARQVVAKRLRSPDKAGGYDRIGAETLRKNDLVLVEAREQRPRGRRGIDGVASGGRERGHGRVRAGAARGGR